MLLKAGSELLDGWGVCICSREAIPVLDGSGKEGVVVVVVVVFINSPSVGTPP